MELKRLRSIDTSSLKDRVRPRVRSRGIPPALIDHPLLDTDDVAEAQASLRTLLGSVRIEPHPDHVDRFHASANAVMFRDIALAYVDFVAPVRITSLGGPSDQLVLMPLNGSSQVISGYMSTQATTIRAALPRPATSLTMVWEIDSPHLMVQISREAIRSYLTRLLGRTVTQSPVFDLAMDLTVERANRWNTAIQLLHGELFFSGSLFHEGMGTGPLEEFVISSLLFAQASNYTAELSPGRARTLSAPVKAAMDLIGRRLAEPLTVTDLAEAAEVSVRAIQAGFRRELQTTPMAYLREQRLLRAREDLADAGVHDGVTVTSVALRWGFTHLGRFASSYRQRFGEAPSATLRS